MFKILSLVILTLLPCIRTEQILDTFDLQRMYIEFSELTKRVSELELRDKVLTKENEELKARIVVLESTTLRQQEKLELRDKILSKENEELEARIEVLEFTTQRQQDELDQLKNMQTEESIDSESTHEELPIKSSTRRSTLTTNNRQSFSQYKGISRIKKAESEMTVAFFITMHSELRNPGAHQQIIFDNVITNIGNGYNKFSGDFRAPVRGVYVFSTTLMADSRSYPYHFQYMVNGIAYSNIYIDHGGTTSQDMVVDLHPGDTVAVHSLDPGHDIYGHGYSSFSGFLLQQNYENPTVVG